MEKHPLYEYRPPEFSDEQKRFLAAAGWAVVLADELVDLCAAIEAQRPAEIERVTFLTRELLRRRLFSERSRAYTFARSYTALIDAGTDLRLIVWDWE